jgi:glycerol-3-phosphate acyltransferase PlsY
MNTNSKTAKMEDMKVRVSTLWIFAVLNYLYADVFSLFFGPEEVTFTAGAVLGFAVLMETSIAMVLLSRVLKYRANRWANIIAGIINTAAVSFSLFAGKPAPYYVFFATMEIACTLFIVWFAWKWRNPEG